MSEEPVDLQQPVVEGSVTYEPPKVTPLGNVRDLLAGASGTQIDGADPVGRGQVVFTPNERGRAFAHGCPFL